MFVRQKAEDAAHVALKRVQQRPVFRIPHTHRFVGGARPDVPAGVPALDVVHHCVVRLQDAALVHSASVIYNNNFIAADPHTTLVFQVQHACGGPRIQGKLLLQTIAPRRPELYDGRLLAAAPHIVAHLAKRAKHEAADELVAFDVDSLAAPDGQRLVHAATPNTPAHHNHRQYGRRVCVEVVQQLAGRLGPDGDDAIATAAPNLRVTH
mmetsp:Transcript_39992/g.100750  ORF Transcript_39992/g.100750 Transcript_39992/m.100750 type:complete len:209 (-) Transcript_39992:1099-1725(-)